jgi:hypothetical protein
VVIPDVRVSSGCLSIFGDSVCELPVYSARPTSGMLIQDFGERMPVMKVKTSADKSQTRVYTDISTLTGLGCQ